MIDWNTRQVVDMLWPPKLPLWKQNADGIQTGDMHGLEVLPDRSAVWASSRLDSRIYGWSLPDLKYIGAVEVGPSANWMTPTPDSQFMYVAISGVDHTVAVDLQKLAIVAKIKTGARPGADQHGDPAPRPRQYLDDRRAAPGEAVTAMAPGQVRLRAPARVGDRRVAAASCLRRLPRGCSIGASPVGVERRRRRSRRAADIESYRSTVEKVFMTDRGGTIPGYAACVMCHTWQTSVRFSLETPATDAGWTVEQSRKNFDVVTKLVNTAIPETSRLLLKPLAPEAGGLGHTGGTYWTSRDEPEYQALLKWIRSLPADRYVAAAEPPLDFEFFRSCVQRGLRDPARRPHPVQQLPRGRPHRLRAAASERQAWTDEEAKRAFRSISRLIIPGNPEQSRFLLKPLHPDGGGSYTHNGPRRWQSRDDPEWQMLAAWVRGEKTGRSCS